nr:uncharacterized protein LOC112211663 isoform X2 [Halyomorpha halys]
MADETYPSISTIFIKEEMDMNMEMEMEMDCDGPSQMKEELLHPDEAGGLAHVKEETFVKQEEELLIRDEDSSTAPSFLQSDDSNPSDMDFVKDEQQLESFATSSGGDVLSKRNEKKSEEGKFFVFEICNDLVCNKGPIWMKCE